MSAATSYLRRLHDHLGGLLADDRASAIEQAAVRAAGSIAAGGVLHVFGTGHSQLVALELAGRAGGLAAVRPLVDPALSPERGRRAAATERLPGYGQLLVETDDVRAGEVLVVVSNSGLNAVPIDVAVAARELGAYVVGVTSHAHGDAATPRHPSGQRLRDVVDLAIDTGAPAGDAVLDLADGTATGPTSTILSAAVVHALTARVAELLVEAGDDAHVLVSQNLDVPDDVNAERFARYADRGPT